MYADKLNASFYNVSFDGYDIIAEEINANESYNRRETIRHNIIGGTQSVMRGNYLVRDYTLTTHFLIDPEYPDVYDDIFREWQSKPVEVISKYMGGKFNAEVIIKRHPNDSPNYLSLEIQVIEIPDNSLIPHDIVRLPADKISPVKIKKKKNSKNTKTNKKQKKNTKNNKKGKGQNITKTGR